MTQQLPAQSKGENVPNVFYTTYFFDWTMKLIWAEKYLNNYQQLKKPVLKNS